MEYTDWQYVYFLIVKHIQEATLYCGGYETVYINENPMHTYLAVSSTEFNETYFCVDMG